MSPRITPQSSYSGSINERSEDLANPVIILDDKGTFMFYFESLCPFLFSFRDREKE